MIFTVFVVFASMLGASPSKAGKKKAVRSHHAPRPVGGHGRWGPHFRSGIVFGMSISKPEIADHAAGITRDESINNETEEVPANRRS